MRARLITATFLCALLFGSLLQPDPVYFAALLGLMLLGAAWEWSGFLRLPGNGARVAYVVLVLAGCMATWLYLWEPASFVHLLQLTTLFWVAAFLWLLRAPLRVGRWAAALAGLWVLVPSTMALLRVASEWTQGIRAVPLIVGVAVAMDTGGFVGGRAFGRHKLAPRISPGKTWEGLYGGVVVVFAMTWLLSYWLPYARWPFVGLAVVCGGFAVVGDLTESLLKRANGLKDSGRMLPGHGGMLDRIDSITAAAPVMTLCLIWLGAGT